MRVSDSDGSGSGSGSGSVLVLDLVVDKEREEKAYSMIKLRQSSLKGRRQLQCGVYGGGRRRRLAKAVEVGLS